MCTNVAPTVVEMDPVAASQEFVMKVARTDGVVYNVEHVKIQNAKLVTLDPIA